MRKKFFLSTFFYTALAVAYFIIALIFYFCHPISFIVRPIAHTDGGLQIITAGQVDVSLSSAVQWITLGFLSLFLLFMAYVNANHTPWRGLPRAKRWGIPVLFGLAFLLSSTWLIWGGSGPSSLLCVFLPTGIIAAFSFVQGYYVSHRSA